MVSKAIACLLITLTFISPSACCCSFEAAVDWVFAGIFLETGIPQSASCCHQATDATRHCASQGGPIHHDDADHHCEGSTDGSHRCPCQEDGSRGTALLSTLDLHASTAVSGLNCLLQLYVVPTLAICNDAPSTTSIEVSSPKGLCETGQGILRAYGRLRI